MGGMPVIRNFERKLGHSTDTKKDTDKRTSESNLEHVKVGSPTTVSETYRGKRQSSDVPLEPANSPDAQLIAQQREHLRINGPREQIRVENPLKMPYTTYR